MPYFSAVFARSDTGWIGTEPDLTEVTGLDDIADIMREAAVETAADTVVLLVEQEDEWFAVVRLDDGEDPRIFLSDDRAPLSSELADMLSEQFDDSEDAATGDPVGDPELLGDLGTRPDALAALGERTLPGDALSVIAEGAGFAEEYDRLR
ncbi:tRNA adenosine deaminase-associated protein [Actinoallomurus purpureus]|uniref:tRNA adenosine deaminase-associated protein n=1 Tax=Actinoallomurus purpureus TaxID=478114 RepID=UPI00209204C2|nr:tRNA adenosine deaminase-associated protein [Actinoallomurus purpureus]MCO6007216.1 tRNA adenosine deaminase-associated protein [Actinoallomurus purpureus]